MRRAVSCSYFPRREFDLVSHNQEWSNIMTKLILAFALGMTLVSSTVAVAADNGTRDEAVAMVKAVQAAFAKDGAEATFKAVTDKKFVDRDLYPFVYTLDGVAVAHGANPALVGKNLIDLKDQTGKLLIREVIDTAKSGGGWVDFMWPNPVTKAIEPKSSFVEKLGDQWVVGVGVYR